MLNFCNRILWAVATVFIVTSSIYFSFRLKGIQFHFKEMFHNLFHKQKNQKGIGPFQVLMMTLAGRIGVGSIAGIALAIYIGGVGSIFWIWVMAILSSVLAYGETVLGMIYKKRDSGDIYKGGPAYYIASGLGKKKLGMIYAILILICYIGGFLGIQSNTITKSIQEIKPVNSYIVGIVIVVVTSLIIFGGVKKIASATGKIVPIMTLAYVIFALYIMIRNYQLLPSIFHQIIKEAFHFKPFIGGFLTSFIVGIQRGIFSNEAGLGTGSIAASTSNSDSPTAQGYIQILGIYITSLFICTATAMIILTSQYDFTIFTDVNGIEITQMAFQYHLGNVGNIFVFLSILLFAFSTILTGYYYGESSLKYFTNKMKPIYLIILKIITLIVVFTGCIMSSTTLWRLVDVLVAILAIINIYGLFGLREDIVKELEYYRLQKHHK